jgi:6-phosphogluconate dehydrogenase
MQVALVGLGVMGKNLALNLVEQGMTLVAYDKNPDAGAELLSCAQSLGIAERLHIVSDLADMVKRLDTPRSVLLLVPAGELVDKVCQDLIEAGVEKGDIIVDCGNSNYKMVLLVNSNTKINLSLPLWGFPVVRKVLGMVLP